MKSVYKEISIRELTAGYENNNDEGVVGFGGGLDIRPKYQREFIYKDESRNKVIESLRDNMPIGEMWWAKSVAGSFEVLDGQQRTISICEYVNGAFALNSKAPQYFDNLEKDEQEQILNYTLRVNIFSGNEKEKLKWFKTINIAGETLTNQEIRNAVYSGTWLSAAKKYFSKPNCPAHNMAKEYLKGSAIRQNYLETALNWISGNNPEQYMATNQHNKNASELWLYFNSVIEWTKTTFPNYRKEMKGVNFGELYNKFKDEQLDSVALETEILKLMQDEDVTKKSGIYSYVLTRKEKYLNVRNFSPNMRRESYTRQDGVCPSCTDHFEIEEMEADHITPWSKDGKTNAANCQMLCMSCNRTKSNK